MGERTRQQLPWLLTLMAGLVVVWFLPVLRPVFIGEPPELWRGVLFVVVIAAALAGLERLLRHRLRV